VGEAGHLDHRSFGVLGRRHFISSGQVHDHVGPPAGRGQLGHPTRTQQVDDVLFTGDIVDWPA
jgi:hypothetical protein